MSDFSLPDKYNDYLIKAEGNDNTIKISYELSQLIKTACKAIVKKTAASYEINPILATENIETKTDDNAHLKKLNELARLENDV